MLYHLMYKECTDCIDMYDFFQIRFKYSTIINYINVFNLLKVIVVV